jgi:hypothetical protein
VAECDIFNATEGSSFVSTECFLIAAIVGSSFLESGGTLIVFLQQQVGCFLKQQWGPFLWQWKESPLQRR